MNNVTDKYKNGMDMNIFKRIPEVSNYNGNYYVGLNEDLLYKLSDDDETSEWFVIKGIYDYFIGNSYVSQGDLLEKLKHRNT